MRPAVGVLGRVIGGILCAALVAAWIRQPGPPTYTLTADFNRAGLNIRSGDEVRVRGFPVGTVERIETDRSDFSARYVLRIDRDVRVAAASGAKVVPKTLFGDKYVELDPAPAGERAMAPGTHIPQERTKAVTEFQQVLDRFTPVLQSVDPAALGGTISALAEGVGSGVDLGLTVTGFGSTFDEIAARQADIATLLTHLPGTAATFGDHAGDMAAAASNMGEVARMLAEHRPELARFLEENAELLGQAGDLMTSERERILRLTRNGFDVLRMVAARPGSIRGFMAGQAATTYGLPTVVHHGVMYAAIPHLMVNFPTPKKKAPVEEGNSAIGPDVDMYYPPPPGQPEGGSPPPPDQQAPASNDPTGLGQLLQLVASGGVR